MQKDSIAAAAHNRSCNLVYPKHGSEMINRQSCSLDGVFEAQISIIIRDVSCRKRGGLGLNVRAGNRPFRQ